MADTTTRAVTKSDVLRVLAKRDSVLANLPVPLSTTADSSTSQITDTKLGRGTSQSNRFDARVIEIIQQQDSPDTGTTDGSIAGVDDAGFDSTSILTISPIWDVAPNSATNYLIYPLGLAAEVLNELYSEILRDTRAPHYWFPSLVSDPDLTNSASYTDDTDWNTVGTPSTGPEFVSTAANVFLGEFAVHCVADAADEGFESLDIDVTETETIQVSVYVHVNVGSMDVVLYNSTANSVITTVVIDEPAWTEVRFSGAVPAGAELISIRFLSNASADDFYVSAPIVLQTTADRWYDAPSWLSHSGQIRGARYLDANTSAVTNNTYVPLSGRPKGLEMPGMFEMSRAVHQVKIAGLQAADGRPVYFDVIRNFDDVTTNSGTTVADRQYLRDALVAAVLKNWDDPQYPIWARRAINRARALDYNPREIIIESNPKVLV